MKRKLIYGLMVSAALGNGAADAATNEALAATTNAVPLETLVAQALRENPELQFYMAELAAARAGRKAAGLWSNPQVSGLAGYKTSREISTGLNAEGVAWAVSVMQPFEWPGRIGLRKAIANRDVELAELGLERFRAALAGRVRTLAFGLFAAQEKAATAGE